MILNIIKQPYIVSFTGNPVAFTLAITPYRAAEQKKDYKIVVRVEVEEDFKSNTFSEVKEFLLYPGDNGVVTASIEKVLHSFLTQKLPRLTQDVLLPLTEQCKRYQISYRLLNGNDLVDGTLKTSPTFYALRGGISYQEWNPKKFFTENLSVQKTFLRFPAKKEYVFADEYKFLSWVSGLPNNVVQSVYVTIGYSDGTQSDSTILKTIQLEPWQPCLTAAGFNQLNLAAIADATKTAIWYELSVSNGRLTAWRGVASSAFCLQDYLSENNGQQGWTMIEQYYTDDNTLVPGIAAKANAGSDYVAPKFNLSACPVFTSRISAWRVKASTSYCLTDGSGNITGEQGWTTLEKYYTDDNSLVSPVTEKSNTSGDSNYVAPVTNTTACPVGAHFGATTFVSGDDLVDVEVANFSGIPGATVVIKLDNVINNNGGTLKVNGSAAYLNNTWSVVLDGSGNGVLNVEIDGVTNSSSVILGHFTIISISVGTIGSPNTYQISKVF